MKFNIGQVHIEVSIGVTAGVGELLKATVVMPVGEGIMFAGKLELSDLFVKGGSAIPCSTQSMLYKQGSKYAEDMVRGWMVGDA